jgi:hypothetical protein
VDRLPDGERAAILAAVQADGRNGPTSGVNHGRSKIMM